MELERLHINLEFKKCLQGNRVKHQLTSANFSTHTWNASTKGE